MIFFFFGAHFFFVPLCMYVTGARSGKVVLASTCSYQDERVYELYDFVYM